MSAMSGPERRQLKRTLVKKPASLIVKRGLQVQRIPCLVCDNSQEGFKIGGTFSLKQGQLVEVILDEYSSTTVPCRVMWVGKPGSKQGGEAGLRIKT